MADAPKLLGTDTLRQAYPKFNQAIDNANEALGTANTAKSTADTAKSTADTALVNSESTQTQLDTIVINGDSSVEAAQARVDAGGNTFTTLKERLDSSDSQLAEITTYKTDDTYGNGITPDIPIDTEVIRKRQSTLYGEAQRKLRLKEAVTMATLGDSTFYGQDTTSADIRPASTGILPDGSTHTFTRASMTPAEAMQTYLNVTYNNMVTVLNRGYSGDWTKRAYSRWITPSGADITVMMFGINDSGQGNASVPTEDRNIQTHIEWYEKLIIREIMRGSAVVILLPIKQKVASNRTIDSFAEAQIALGKKYNVPVIENDFLANYNSTFYSDGIHLNGKGYRVIGTRLASVFVGKGAYKPKYVSNGSKLLTRTAIDNIVYAGNSAFVNSSDSVAPAEQEAGKGLCALLAANDYIVYSFYAETDDLVVLPILWRNGQYTVELDFGIEQPEFTLDTSNFYSNNFSLFPSSAYTISDSITETTSVKNTYWKGKGYIHIATKGWHTLRIKCITNNVKVSGLDFIDFKTFASKDNRGQYIGYTHPVYQATPDDVLETRISMNVLKRTLGLEDIGSDSYKQVPMKLIVNNKDNSILEYTFIRGVDGGSTGWAFKGLTNRVNMVTTPTYERVVSNIAYDSVTDELVITWGDKTKNQGSFIVRTY